MTKEVVVYDGDCGICEWSAGWIRRHIPRVEVVSHTSYGITHLATVLLITPQEQYAGARAVSLILKRSESQTARIIGAVIYAPGIRYIAKAIYFVVAKNRRRLSSLLSLKACPLPDKYENS